MPNIDKDLQKEILKEAISEWLDKQFATLGKWTLGGICSAGLAALVVWMLSTQGWHK
ncbi:hypothetical protein [Noviherbaspirillum sp. Root189]|uniref:hypothetical protein n=1 Tax=Noviherbaspirillum sp. Root189 TaxID=1736487 RepID=UPI0012E3BB1F|nr:hypothetical protein [Noviherbaspirillum sp. Root189]